MSLQALLLMLGESFQIRKWDIKPHIKCHWGWKERFFMVRSLAPLWLLWGSLSNGKVANVILNIPWSLYTSHQFVKLEIIYVALSFLSQVTLLTSCTGFNDAMSDQKLFHSSSEFGPVCNRTSSLLLLFLVIVETHLPAHAEKGENQTNKRKKRQNVATSNLKGTMEGCLQSWVANL